MDLMPLGEAFCRQRGWVRCLAWLCLVDSMDLTALSSQCTGTGELRMADDASSDGLAEPSSSGWNPCLCALLGFVSSTDLSSVSGARAI